METITIAGGCFWCTEAIFQKIKGVIKVTPGYSGGNVRNPSYELVCSGTTGHAEAIQIEFDEKQITLRELLEVFFALHDPTTLNRQGADSGTQYRSVVFFRNQNQKQTTEDLIKELTDAKIYKDKIVTEIVPFDEFYEAEDYHKNYFENNRLQPYCQVTIDPKIKKLFEKFPDKLKTKPTS